MIHRAILGPPSVSVLAGEGRRSWDGHPCDAESRGWLRALSGTGPEREEALERLHALLLRAARFEVARRDRAGAFGSGSGDADDFAVVAAGDAMLAILSKLQTYRGDSRFTTWASKFVLLETAAKLRRRPWQGREVPLEDDGWAQSLDDRRAAPDAQAGTRELIGAVSDAIAEVLTPHQRAVFVALTINDVPIDVLAERLATTRGAVYRTLHDARLKLRARLARDGLATGLPPPRNMA